MAGTVVLSSDKMYGEIREVIFTCTSDASLATIPDTDLCALTGTVYGDLSGWALAAVETKPGTFSVMLIDDPVEILLARFDGRPAASRDYPLYNLVSFALREAI